MGDRYHSRDQGGPNFKRPRHDGFDSSAAGGANAMPLGSQNRGQFAGNYNQGGERGGYGGGGDRDFRGGRGRGLGNGGRGGRGSYNSPRPPRQPLPELPAPAEDSGNIEDAILELEGMNLEDTTSNTVALKISPKAVIHQYHFEIRASDAKPVKKPDAIDKVLRFSGCPFPRFYSGKGNVLYLVNRMEPKMESGWIQVKLKDKAGKKLITRNVEIKYAHTTTVQFSALNEGERSAAEGALNNILHAALANEMSMGSIQGKNSFLLLGAPFEGEGGPHGYAFLPTFRLMTKIMDGNVFITMNVSKQIFHGETIGDMLRGEGYRNAGSKDACRNVSAKIKGQTVVTTYVNPLTGAPFSYQVEKLSGKHNGNSPMSKHTSETFAQYYSRQYGVQFDSSYPMVMAAGKRNCFIPAQLCYVTVDLDQIRGRQQTHIRREMLAHCSLSPAKRVDLTNRALQQMSSTLNKIEESKPGDDQRGPGLKDVIKGFGLKIDGSLRNTSARRLQEPEFGFGDGESVLAHQLNHRDGVWFDRNKQRIRRLYDIGPTLNLDGFRPDIAVLAVQKEIPSKSQQAFISNLQGIGVKIDSGNVLFKSVASGSFSSALAELPGNPALVVAVVDNGHFDYAEVKRVCYEKGIPSQCVKEKSFIGEKMNSVITNVCVKVAMKFGATPWQNSVLKRQFNCPTMLVGIDTVVEKLGKSNAGTLSMVASMNPDVSKYFAHAVNKECDTGKELCMFMTEAVNKFVKLNGTMPFSIIVYRSNSASYNVLKKEIGGIINGHAGEQGLKGEFGVKIDTSDGSKTVLPFALAFVNVSQRASFRFYKPDNPSDGNPSPGSVVVNSPHQSGKAEWTMVANETSRIGQNMPSAVPTSYRVVWWLGNAKTGDYENDNKLDLNWFMETTHQLCNVYYNYGGAVRVPVVIQWAKRLADRFVKAGREFKYDPNSSLEDRLCLYFS